MADNAPISVPAPAVVPPLDPAFRPAALAHRGFEKLIDQAGGGETVSFALERGLGTVSLFATRVLPDKHSQAGLNVGILERLLKFLLWSRGGAKVHFAGPARFAEVLRRHYTDSATGRFDAAIMGEKIYDRPFEILVCAADELPREREVTTPLGRHWEGCRIGFDLGASDRKVAAVFDGKTVFSEETPWDPRPQSDPQWHFDRIMESLRRAAAHLPRVDAIGGSAAGVYVDNQVKVASLFRGVPDDLFRSRVQPLFLDLRKAWGNIPFDVVNDGEVTALAGSMAIKKNGVLGLALGSSQAAGYVTAEGNITSWLNELAFAPVDYNPGAPVDEWSGDYGCGVQYFSQQCVGRLLEPAGISLPPNLGLPERLVELQRLMERGDERAPRIYETIGVYLGYAVAHYATFYDFQHVLLLGRVTTGRGGDLIVSRATHVLRTEFPELAIEFHMPNEQEKRHGQAMAAASLPALLPTRSL